MRDFVAQCDVTIKHASDDVELDIFRSSMGASRQRIPDGSRIQYKGVLLYREDRFRQREVTVLILRDVRTVFVFTHFYLVASAGDQPPSLLIVVSKICEFAYRPDLTQP